MELTNENPVVSVYDKVLTPQQKLQSLADMWNDIEYALNDDVAKHKAKAINRAYHDLIIANPELNGVEIKTKTYRHLGIIFGEIE